MATSTPRIRRVFLDSSVFFAATYSAKGAARDLLLATIEGRFALVLSDYVIDETERNVLKRASHVYSDFLRLRDNLLYLVSQPSDALIVDTARIVVEKDAPIIAGARAVNATLVATYDRKHLLSKRQEIFAAFGVNVATPEEILANL
jgi:predicted nucleic acid-binding protein